MRRQLRVGVGMHKQTNEQATPPPLNSSLTRFFSGAQEECQHLGHRPL